MKKIFSAMALSLLIGMASATAQEIKPFVEGERAAFLGNSITDGGRYHSYIWLYYMTRFPNMPISVYNCGVGGDTAYDMYKRLDNDVFSKNPTVLMVTFGMNDSGYFEYNGDNAAEFGEQKYQECIENYKKMEQRLLQLPNTRIVALGTSPYDETAKIEGNLFKKKNETIKRIVAYQMEAAKRNGWEYLDMNAPMVALNAKGQEKDPSFTLCGSDRIHPDNDGHMVMAYLFLKAQGMAGKPVAKMEVNAGKKSVVAAENCTISNVKKVGRSLTFDYKAESLPYPMDTVPRGWGYHRTQAMAADVVPFYEEMNQEILKVTGLSGNYKLLIDGEEIGVWTGKQLAEGINLAKESKTPQYQQALAVMHLNELRMEIVQQMRVYAWCQHGFFQQQGLLNANNRKAIEVMDANVDKNGWLKGNRDNYSRLMHDAVREARMEQHQVLVDKIYEVNKPVTRKVELRKM